VIVVQTINAIALLIATLVLARYVRERSRDQSEQGERSAMAALMSARAGTQPIEPDGWAGDRPYLSAQLVDRVAGEKLEAHGIEVDFEGLELSQLGASHVARARFCWRRGRWRSPSTTIEVLLDGELPMGSRATAALTTARKVYLRGLLCMQQSADPEGALNKSAAIARVSVRESTKRMLRAYAAKGKRAESAIIRMALPSRRAQLEAPRFDELQQIEIAALGWWLITQVGDPAAFVEGELPAGTFDRPDDVVSWMEGEGDK
jgi:hypothetical protein